MRVLGVMTGTSCDGLDAACIEVDRESWQPLWAESVSYPASLRKRVLEAQKPQAKLPLRFWLKLHAELGDWYAATLNKMIARNPAQAPDVIANHGQTVAHFPELGMSLQLGEPARIARATGTTVVSSFRDGDMAAGGQGAPLVPLFHRLLAHVFGGEGIAIHNLGGISNLTYIGPDDRLLAFDTGPGNIWIDAATELATRGKRRFDAGGKLASQGTVDAAAVERLLKLPYFARKAPKSTGRDDFPFALLKSATRARGNSLIATATALTAESIALAYEREILKRKLPLNGVYFCGGGARNEALLRWVQMNLPDTFITTLDEQGFDSQLVEAQAFAFFGFMALIGKPLGGKWTGAQGFAPPAHVVPGENWDQVLAQIVL